ncbi:MAG: trypsin-like serine protease [Bdellovibrio sp.]|nr:trypsin-like serine protease [Bdellovibrio sp.]
MIHSKLILAFSLLLFFGCAKSSTDKSSADNGKPIAKGTRTCYPDNELLVSGIVGGSVVHKVDDDSKNVVMILSGDQLCTATAITKDILLTAAHCVKGSKAAETYMFTSSTLSCESGFDSRRDRIGVRKIVVHEGYTSDEHSAEYSTNDLALVILNRKLPASYPIFPIADENVVEPDSALYFWGFGEVGNGRGGDGLLRKTQVTSSEYNISLVREKIIVNQSAGHGICHGDSGGPGFIKQSGLLKILGVNSYVSGTTEASLCSGQSYLTLISSYKVWLEKNLAIEGETLN